MTLTPGDGEVFSASCASSNDSSSFQTMSFTTFSLTGGTSTDCTIFSSTSSSSFQTVSLANFTRDADSSNDSGSSTTKEPGYSASIPSNRSLEPTQVLTPTSSALSGDMLSVCNGSSFTSSVCSSPTDLETAFCGDSSSMLFAPLPDVGLKPPLTRKSINMRSFVALWFVIRRVSGRQGARSAQTASSDV